MVLLEMWWSLRKIIFWAILLYIIHFIIRNSPNEYDASKTFRTAQNRFEAASLQYVSSMFLLMPSFILFTCRFCMRYWKCLLSDVKCQLVTDSILNAGLFGLQSEWVSQRLDGLCQGIFMTEEPTKRTGASLDYIYSALEDKASQAHPL